MRIAALLPSATEMVCALGVRADLVARSHECDFPPGVEELPVLTSARIGPLPSSRAIDSAVRDALRDALSIYQIDLPRLREARPEVIVTQDLCEVCAVSLDDVRSAVARLASQDVRIVTLHPTRLADIWADIGRIADAIGRSSSATELVRGLRERVDAVGRRASRVSSRPRVLTIEWIDPIMIGGMWMPELVTVAGGEPLVTQPGDHAVTLQREQLAALDPEVVLVKPCGFDLPRTLAELPALRAAVPSSWRARLYAADGNAYFNRPGPRIVESLEILAACIHPDAFQDFARKHATGFCRLEPHGDR